jgi:hypothetical protein
LRVLEKAPVLIRQKTPDYLTITDILLVLRMRPAMIIFETHGRSLNFIHHIKTGPMGMTGNRQVNLLQKLIYPAAVVVKTARI